MPVVTYRGEVAELQGQQVDVPNTVLSSGQATSWIESQHREQQARDAAAAEAQQRQDDLLRARMEEQRRAMEAEAEAEEQQATRSELEASLKAELSDLAHATITGAAAIAGKAEAIEAQCQQWEQRHEQLVSVSEVALSEAQAQVAHAQAVTASSSDLVGERLAAAEARVAELESELRTTVLSLRGPEGQVGPRGLAGSGFGYVDSDPNRITRDSLGQRFFGREVVAGDMLLQRTPTSLKVWRTADGNSWQQIDEILNKQELISSRLSVADNSTKSTTVVNNPQVTIFRGSNGGEGGLKLLTDTLTTTWRPIAEAFNRGDLPVAADPDEAKIAKHELIGDVKGVHFHLLAVNTTTLESRFVSGTIYIEAAAGNIESITYYDDRSNRERAGFDPEITFKRVGTVAVPVTDNFPGGTADRWVVEARIVHNIVEPGTISLSGRVVPLRAPV